MNEIPVNNDFHVDIATEGVQEELAVLSGVIILGESFWKDCDKGLHLTLRLGRNYFYLRMVSDLFALLRKAKATDAVF